MSLKKKIFLFLDLLVIAGLIILDQYTKYLAVIHLKDKPAYNIISGVLELNYLENQGAAFGMLPNQKIFFIFVVDFIYFVRLNFPIFNVADIYVSIAAIFLIILLLFVYKEKDLYFISFKQKRYREIK